ncbi:MAG: DUF4384 domain-containing protein [Gemmatimonadales bacterium]
MLLSLFLLATHALTAAPALAAAPGKDPPVRVWFNSDGNYALGDRAKVHAKSAADGYLIVLRADAAGRVRVLFPLDPQGDQRITGGKKYELKSRAGREAFIADDTSGHGTVLAAIAQSPFRVEEFVQEGRWDLRALSDTSVRDDPEAGLIDLIRRMKAPDDHFDYDVETYVVSEQYARRLYPYPYAGLGWWG